MDDETQTMYHKLRSQFAVQTPDDLKAIKEFLRNRLKFIAEGIESFCVENFPSINLNDPIVRNKLERLKAEL